MTAHDEFSLGCENKIFVVYNMLNSLLTHAQTRLSFSERRDAHNDAKNMWNLSSRFRDKFMERTEISAFFLTFFAVAGV